MIYKMTLADSTDSMTFDLLEVPIVDKDIEGAVDNTLVNGNVFTDYLWLKKQWVQKWSIMCPDEYDRLRGFYTRQWSNASVPTYKLFYGANIDTYDTGSGDYILVNSTAPLGSTMSLTKLNGNATQQTYSGKNLASLQVSGVAISSGTVGGVSFTITDGIIHLSGTTEANKNFFFDSFRTNSGSATFWIEVTGYTDASGNSSMILQQSDDNSSWANLIEISMLSSVNKVRPVTLDSSKYYRIRWYVNSNTFTNATIKVQLEYGSTKTSFEQYVGGTASPNPSYPQAIETVTGRQTVEVVSPRKNIANPQTFADWADKTNSLCIQYGWGSETTRPEYGEFNGRSHVVSYAGSTLYTSRNSMTNPTYDEACHNIYAGIFEENKRYTISADLYSEASNGTPSLCFYYTDGTYSFVQGTGVANQWVHMVQTSNANKTIASLGITYASASKAYIDLDTFQIEEGESATTFEPFVSQDYEVNLGKNLFNWDRTLGEPSNTTGSNTTPRLFDYNEFVVGIAMNNYYTVGTIESYSVQNGEITVKPSLGAYGLGFAVEMSARTNYTLSFTKTTTETGDVRVGFYKADGTWLSYSIAGTASRLSFQTPQDCAFGVIIFRPSQGIECTFSNIQLERGLQATAYTPYMRISRNMFSGFETLATGSTFSDGTLTISSSTSNISNSFSIEPNKDYTLSWVLSAQTRVYIREYDSADTMLTNVTKYTSPYTFTASATASYAKIYFSPSTSEAFPVTVRNIQFEQSSSQTFYEPYNAQLELAKIGTYQDYIWNDNGTWKIHKEIYKIIWNGTEAWQQYSSNVYLPSGSYPVGTGNPTGVRVIDGICNRHIFDDSNTNLTYNSTAHTGFELRNLVSYWGATTATVADWKTWLQSHNIVIYNALATPFDTTITEQALIDDLNTISELYGGQNNIMLVPSAGAQGTMEILIHNIIERETILTPATPVRLTLTDDGIINPCGCRRNIQLKMRETAQ